MTTKTKKPAAKAAAKKPVAKTETTAAESKPAKAAAPKRAQQNGVSLPGAGTSCRAVWDAIDKLLAQDKKITLEAVRELAGDTMADATIRTQRQRHKTFHGLTA